MSTESISLIVTIGAVLLAVIASIMAFRARLHDTPRRENHWRDRCVDLDRRLSRIDSIFGSFPGLILVWEDNKPDLETAWGEPRIYGSAAALASIVRFAEPGRAKDVATRVLNGLADRETMTTDDSVGTLRTYIAGLRSRGEAFSASIILPDGNKLEANGRVAGRQVVLWLEDSDIRGEDEKKAIGRMANEAVTASKDPVAFVEMMGLAPFPLWRTSGTGQLIWANQAYAEAVGAKNVRAVVDGQIYLDEEAVKQARHAISKNERVTHVRHIVMGGQNKSVSVNMFPVTGGAAGIALDASETEALKNTLTRHIRTHDKTLNNLEEAVVIFGGNQKMTFHNKAFADLFQLDEDWYKQGHTHAEWLDHLRERRLLPEQSDYREWKASELAFYSEMPSETPAELWHLPNGRTFRLVRLMDPQGGLSLLFSDMTDTLTMKGQFNTLINVQRATLDKLSEGIAVFGTDGRLKIYNSAFEELWQLSENDLKGSPRFSEIIELCMPLHHDRGFWTELIARATDPSPEIRKHVDGEINRADGKILTWLSRPLPDGATLFAWDDVTGARQAEAALIERAEALEAADRMKSEFVGHVSYQLRTPLTTIAGYADFLQNGMAGELEGKQSEYVFAIQSASEDLKKIIDDILDIAAIEANVLDLDLGDVDVYKMLHHALDYVATKAEDTQVALELECSEDIGVIRADETRLKQIVYNLLSNALRFTGAGGTIELGADKADGGIKIWVKDDGVGISPERQPQVFESFQSSRGGAGLGLALVQRFIERHGGWVELESEEGEGTQVSCYLPREAATGAAHPELFAQTG